MKIKFHATLKKFWKAPYQCLLPEKLRHEGTRISSQADVTALASKLSNQPSPRGVLMVPQPFYSSSSVGKSLGCRMVLETWLSRALRVSISAVFGRPVILTPHIPWCPEHLHGPHFYWDVLQRGSGKAPRGGCSPCQQHGEVTARAAQCVQSLPCSTQTPLSSEHRTPAISQT